MVKDDSTKTPSSASIKEEIKFAFLVILASYAVKPSKPATSAVKQTKRMKQMDAEAQDASAASRDPAIWQPPWFHLLITSISGKVLLLEENITASVLPLWQLSMQDHQLNEQGSTSSSSGEPAMPEDKKNNSNDVYTRHLDSVLQLQVAQRITLLAECTVCCIVAFRGYDSRVKVLLRRAASVLELSKDEVLELDERILNSLDSISQATPSKKGYQKLFTRTVRTGEAARSRPLKKGISKEKMIKAAKIGTAAAVGGALIGLTGGLAAPAIGAGIATVGAHFGLAGVATLGTLAASSAGVAITSTLFTATGATLHGYKMNKRLNSIVKELWFYNISFAKTSTKPCSSKKEAEQPSVERRRYLSIAFGIHGWVNNRKSLPSMWGANEAADKENTSTSLFTDSELLYLIWEREDNYKVGNFFEKFAIDQAVSMSISQTLQYTTLAGLMTAFAFPAYLIKAADIIDNPWILAVKKARLVAKELADILTAHIRQPGERARSSSSSMVGSRPVNLYGYSAGCIIIFYCLVEIHERAVEFERSRQTGPEPAGSAVLVNPYLGIIENAVFISAPVLESVSVWETVVSVVAGKVVNCYSPNDWMLSLIYRSTGNLGILAGVTAINVKGMWNVNLSELLGIKLHSEVNCHKHHLAISEYLDTTIL